MFSNNTTTSRALQVAKATAVASDTEELGQNVIFPFPDGTKKYLRGELNLATQLLKKIPGHLLGISVAGKVLPTCVSEMPSHLN